MRLYQVSERIEQARQALAGLPFRFGKNKEQELLRLLFEISQREAREPSLVLRQAQQEEKWRDAKQAFSVLKQNLLKRRYPSSCLHSGTQCFYLPKVSFDDRLVMQEKRGWRFYPETIYVEEEARQYPLTHSIIKKFPRAECVSIGTLYEHIARRQKAAKEKGASAFQERVRAYNERARTLFLVKERYDFLKPCPCTKAAKRCGYDILNMGFGCPYDCSYCFLQGYDNSGGITIPVNTDDFIGQAERFVCETKRPLRIGTGEFCDSLVLDEITGFSKVLVDFFSRCENATIELKTKSACVSGLLPLAHKGRSIIAWSLNPQPIIDSDERGAASLAERLGAARQCIEAGYRVAFHFDPIIYSSGWQENYEEVVNNLFDTVKGNEENIAWISLGTLRFNPCLKTIIEQRFPQSTILHTELILEFDGKLRYSRKLRSTIYKKMYAWICKRWPAARVYLCMEPLVLWREVLSRDKL